MLLEFSGNNMTRIAYSEVVDDMGQEEGTKATFSISGDTIKITTTHDWDGDETNWVPEIEKADLSFSLSGNKMEVAAPEGDLLFNKKSFSKPTELAGNWTVDFGTYSDDMTLSADGTYDYTDKSGEGPENYIGQWSATSDMIRFITTDYAGSSIYIESLYYYEIAGGTLTFSWGDVFTPLEYTRMIDD
ncbi:MAG: hypothetical protein RBT69_05280 [Spirochaetia bacterium]|jgi:hypothetical protein|nr:hypothetical protein [Spirochaetia bacterium]